jgi:hypothetical protein
MKKRAVQCSLVVAVALLSGCATPRDQCISNATQLYRNAETALATAQGNINRGYALHTERVPYTVMRTCYRNYPYTYGGIPYACPSTQFRTQTTPVPIDVAEERTKLAQYQKLLPKLRQEAGAQVQQCKAQFPET